MKIEIHYNGKKLEREVDSRSSLNNILKKKSMVYKVIIQHQSTCFGTKKLEKC